MYNSYDIIGKAVRDYWNYIVDMGEPIGVTFIIHFYQKYDWDNKWEECTEIAECQDGHEVVFDMDFCEGQTEVKDIVILQLRDVGEMMKGIRIV